MADPTLNTPGVQAPEPTLFGIPVSGLQNVLQSAGGMIPGPAGQLAQGGAQALSSIMPSAAAQQTVVPNQGVTDMNTVDIGQAQIMSDASGNVPAPAPSDFNALVQQAAERVVANPGNPAMEDMILLQRAAQQQPQGSSRTDTSTTSSSSRTSFANPNEIQKEMGVQQGAVDSIHSRAQQTAADTVATAQEISQRSMRTAEELQALTVERQELQQKHEEDFTKFTQEQDKDRKAFLQAAKDLDPKRLTRGKEWIVGIASAMGSFGATIANKSGGSDTLRYLDKAMDRDLDAQKFQVGALKDNLSFTQQIYMQKQQQFQNQLAAKLATKADIMDVAAIQLRGMEQRLKGTEQGARILNEADNLKIQASERRQQSYEQEKVTQASSITKQTTSATTAPKNAAQQALEMIDKGYDARIKAGKAYAEPKGEPTENDKTQFRKTMEAVSAAGQAVKDVERYKTKIGESYVPASPLTFSKSGHQMDVVQTRLTRNLAMAQNKGNLSQGDVESAERQVTGGAWSGSTLETKADEALITATNKIRADIEALPPGMRDEATRRAVSIIGPKNWENALRLSGGGGASEAAEAGVNVRGK